MVESTDGPVILRAHQAITYDQTRRKNEVESLLCVAQAQEHGIIVDSNAQKFGGLQCMVINQEDKRYIIPFLFEEGITIMPHREPTDEEINDLPILDISSPEGKWEPKKLSKGYFDLEIALDRLDARYKNAIIEEEYGSRWH